jgi:transcription elongation GreA/GreB family factor
VDKSALLKLFADTLTQELATLTRAAQESYAAATDPDSKAENKYDTRTIEASYVARGQALRVAELGDSLAAIGSLPRRAWPDGQPIHIGAVVALEISDTITYYVLSPAGGGTHVEIGDSNAYLITPASPLGQKLMGQRVGARIEMPGGLALICEVS